MTTDALILQVTDSATIIRTTDTLVTAVGSNVAGPTGPTGPTGPAGTAATVSVGSTTTGAAGSSAAVSNTGTTSAAVLTFTIPKGDTGATGAAGAAATVSVGSTTTGAAGTSASVSNTGTTSAAVFAFTIPQGAAGAAGATGSFNANSAFQGALEVVSVDSSSTLSGSTAATVSIKTAGAYLFTTNPGANWTTNVRGDGSTTLASMLSVGQSVTVTVMTNNGASAYYCPSGSFQIDGTATGVTMKWLNGASPAAGDASAYDIYTYTIVKTAATPTYTVFAALTKFA